MRKKFRKFKKLFCNDYIFSVFQKIMNILTGLVTVSLINRYLGPSLKGEYTYITNIVTVLAVILGFGFYESYPFSKRKKKEKQLEAYLNVFFMQFLFYLLIGAAIAFVTKNRIVTLVAVLVPVQVFTSQMQMVGIVEFIRFRQILQIVNYFIDMLLTLTAYLLIPQSVSVLLFILLIKDILYIVVYLIKCGYFPKKFVIDTKFIVFLFKFGCFAMLTKLLIELNYRIDVLMLKLFVPYAEIGLYSVGSKLAQYVWLIPDAFKEVIYARTAKSDAVNEIKFVLKLNLSITVFIILFILFFGKVIIYLLFGTDYIAAYSVTCIIFFGIPSMVLYKIISPLYMANGKQKKCFCILLASVIANMTANMIFIPLIGKFGAAVSTVLSYSICGCVFYISFIRDYHLKWYEGFFFSKEEIQKIKKYVKNFVHS